MFNKFKLEFATRLFFALASILFFTACSKRGEADLLETPNTATSKINTNVNSKLFLQLINEQREKGCNCGSTVMPPVPNLVWNDLLAQAALNHSKDMSDNNFFNHVSSNGTTLSGRMEVVGYSWSALAENIAKGQQSEQVVISGWFNSEGHCKNLMNAKYKEVGVARVGNYWTQDFGLQSK